MKLENEICFSLDDFTTIAVYLTGEIEHKNHDLYLGKPN